MNDDDVRALLHHAVADVQPRTDQTDVLARLAADDERRNAARSRLAPALAAAAAVAVVVGGLGLLQHTTPPPRPAVPVPAGRDVSLAVYYVGRTPAGPRLFEERHVLHHVTTSDAQAAFDALLARPDDPDYRPAFPAGTSAAVRVDGNDVTVDFTGDVSRAPAGAAPGTGTVAAQAVVWTLDAILQRPVSVRFTEHGRRVGTLLGSHLTQPVSQGNADRVLSPVSIELPEGAQVTSGTTVRGEAAAFEANVVWELLSAGKVVRHGSTTAGQCCTLSPYAFVLDAPPGRYQLVVRDSDPSDGEGPGVASDSKTVEIR